MVCGLFRTANRQSLASPGDVELLSLFHHTLQGGGGGQPVPGGGGPGVDGQGGGDGRGEEYARVITCVSLLNGV